MTVAHIESKIFVFCTECAERHECRNRRVYLVGGFLFVGFDIGVGVGLHHHVTNRPSQNRIATMAHHLAVNKNLKRFRYRTEFQIGLRERLHIEASPCN